jgi:hypothetical protein
METSGLLDGMSKFRNICRSDNLWSTQQTSVIMKLDSTGAVLWIKYYDTDENEFSYIQETSDGST